MVANVVNVDLARLAVFNPLNDVADASLTPGPGPQRGGIGKQGLEELQGNDFPALVDNRLNTGHSDILQHFQMLEIVVGKGHPKTNTL